MARYVKAREKSEGDSAAPISAKKNGSAAILHLHSRGRASIRGNLKAPFAPFVPLSSFSLRNGPMDERGLSFRTIVRCKTALRIVPLKARASTSRLFGFVNIRKIKIYGGRFVIDYIPLATRILYLLLFNEM